MLRGNDRKRTRRVRDISTNVKAVKEEEHKHSIPPKKVMSGRVQKREKWATKLERCEVLSMRHELEHVDISTYSSSHSGVSSFLLPIFSSHFRTHIIS